MTRLHGKNPKFQGRLADHLKITRDGVIKSGLTREQAIALYGEYSVYQAMNLGLIKFDEPVKTT